MLNKAIAILSALIVAAILIQGCQSLGGYLADIRQATQERSAAYAAISR